jgi:uncharacterized protein YnzC (UPF0291/DUF896 family)
MAYRVKGCPEDKQRITQRIESLDEAHSNLLEVGKPEVFDFFSIYLKQWIPDLAKIIFKEQSEFAENMKNERYENISDYDQYMCYLPPERMAFCVLKEVLGCIIEKLNMLNRSSNDTGDSFDSHKDSLFTIPISKLVEKVADAVSFEIQYDYEIQNFVNNLKEKNHPPKLRNQIINKFKNELKNHFSNLQKSDFKNVDQIIPQDIKSKLAKSLLFYCNYYFL